jgi:hypothetical protein
VRCAYAACALIAVLACVTPAVAAPSAANPVVDQPALLTADDLLIFEVDADGGTLSDGFSAYSSRAGLFIPLGELSRLLDLSITIDPASRRAEGWILSPSRTLSVDLAKGEARVGQRVVPLTRETAVFVNDDIYLRSDVVEQILPLKLSASTNALTLTIKPKEPFPFEQRVERQQRRQDLSTRAEAPAAALTVDTPYSVFTMPAVSLDLAIGGGNHDPKATAEFDLRAAGDLLGAGAQVYAASDQSGQLAELRMLLERKDPNGRDAGPFGATLSDLGDTFSPALPVGARAVAGRGFAITSEPLEQPLVFNQIDLHGELPLGWEVELYVNEVLRGSTSQAVDGRYAFLDVPLAYGLNVIRFVFYGPRGERREEVKRLNVGGAQNAKGKFTYSLGAVQEDRSVIPVGQGDLPPTTTQPGGGELRLSGRVSYGLTDATTVSAGFARYTPAPHDPRFLGMAAVTTSFSGFSVQGYAAHDDQGGSAVALGLAGQLLGASVVVRESEYAGGFLDELQPLEAGAIVLRRDTSLFLDAAVRLGGDALPVSLRLDRAELENGKAILQATGQASHPIGPYLLSSTLTYSGWSGGGASTASNQLTGQMNLSGLSGGAWRLRGGLEYHLLPGIGLDTVYLTADRALAERVALRLAVSQQFGRAPETTFEVAPTWRFNRADISLVGSYTTGANDLRVGIEISMGFLFDPIRKSYRPAEPGVAQGGSVALQAYVDRNGDDQRDSGDTPVAGLAIQGGRRPVNTDSNGEALITGLGSGASAQLQVDPSSVDDPYLAMPPNVIRIVPRPGRVAVVPYALHPTGEVELHVEFQRADDLPRGLSALLIELVAPNGEVAAQGRTEYDGSLLLEGIRPGDYEVRIEPSQAARLNLRLKSPVHLTVAPAGGFVGLVKATVMSQTGGPRPDGGPVTRN